MKDVKVHAKDILRMIPDEELAKLSSSTKVDYCAKVLSGERMFYLLVFALLAADQISQRKLEVVFNNSMFKTLFNISADAHVTHSSISLSSLIAYFFMTPGNFLFLPHIIVASFYTSRQFSLLPCQSFYNIFFTTILPTPFPRMVG